MQSGTGRNSGRITIVVRRIGLAARGCHLGTPRRLRVLPYFGIRNSALCGSRRWIGKHAAGCWAAAIIADEEMNIPPSEVVAYIVGGHHRYFARLPKGDSRAVPSGAVASFDHAVDPGMNIGALLGKHAPSLLLIEENDGTLRKALRCCCSHGRCRVAGTNTGSIPGGFQLFVFTAIKEQKKPESHRL